MRTRGEPPRTPVCLSSLSLALALCLPSPARISDGRKLAVALGDASIAILEHDDDAADDAADDADAAGASVARSPRAPVVRQRLRAHSAAVCRAHFAAFGDAAGDELLISAGNDCRALVWRNARAADNEVAGGGAAAAELSLIHI